MARTRTGAEIDYKAKVARISAEYDKIKEWPPNPTDLTAYAHQMKIARTEYYNTLDNTTN